MGENKDIVPIDTIFNLILKRAYIRENSIIMDMTFRQYIDNPMGRGSSIFSGRDIYKKQYTEKFDKLLLREAGNIYYKLYYDDRNDHYYCYMKMPSETVENFYYDVIIKFLPVDKKVNKGEQNLNNYKVQFYSDDPAFFYTYLHVFMEKDLFIDELKSKVPKAVSKDDKHIRNPAGIVGYVKTLYFAYLFMNLKQLFQKYLYRAYGEQYNRSKFIKEIDDMDKKLTTRQDLERELQKKKRLEEKRKKEQEKNNTTDDSKENQVPIANRVKGAPNISKVKNTPVNKKIGKVKPVKKI